MTKEEIIEYLNVCLDYEQGLYECRRLLETITEEEEDLKQRIYSAALPELPGRPVLAPPFKDTKP